MTLTEKILARAAGKAKVQAGDNLWVKADILMTHDVCGPGTIGVFKREFGKDAKVWDRSKIVIIPDHYIFTADSKSNRNVDILRDFVREQEIPYFYDVIDEPNGHWAFDATKGQLKKQYGSNFAGVCHTALPQKGHTRPGEILFGTDSHTCMAGALNEFATGIGNTAAGFVMGTGRLLLKVPETMHFRLEGKCSLDGWPRTSFFTASAGLVSVGRPLRACTLTGPGLHRLLCRRQDQRFPGVRPHHSRQTGDGGHVWRAGDAGDGARPSVVALGRQNGLGNPGGSRRANDRKRQLRRLPGRPDGYLWPHEHADEVHQRHQPQLPRT